MGHLPTTAVVLLLAVGAAGVGCKRPTPTPPPTASSPAPATSDDTVDAPTTPELAPLVPVHVTVADLHLDAGPHDAGSNEVLDAGPRDAGAEPPEVEQPEPQAEAQPRLCTRDGGDWICSEACWCHRPLAPTTADLRAAASTAQGLWAGGGASLLRGNGERWGGAFHGIDRAADEAIVEPLPATTSRRPRQIVAIAGAGESVWIAGAAGLWAFDGRSWSEIPLASTEPNALAALAAPDAHDLWAVGRGGAVIHGDGRIFSRVDAETTEQLYGVHGSSPRDVWAVGTNATIREWDGSAWHRVEAPIAQEVALLAVWSNGPDDVWIAGDHGLVLHGGAHGFRVVASGTELGLLAIHGVAGEVWIAGQRGTLLHGDARGLRAEESGTFVDLRAIAEAPDGRLWVVGELGALLWKDPGAVPRR